MTAPAPGPAGSIAAAVRAKRVSAAEVARACLDGVGELDRSLAAFLQVFDGRGGDRPSWRAEVEPGRLRETALDRAAAVDVRIAAGHGERLPLAGVPVAVKDNICTRNGNTTCASRFLESYRSPFDATVVRKLEAAGAVIVGKTNMDEFAMGSSCEYSSFGCPRNPWDPTRTPGGSSGGSAAAAGSRAVPIALGSDTGGSIRQPAGFCGCVGMKPTYGRVSRYGLVAFASSLDQIGPLCASVADAALCLEAICGVDAADATSAARETGPLAEGLDEPPERLRVGVLSGAVGRGGNHPGVDAAMARSIEVFRAAGAEVVEIELPHLEYGVPAYYIVAPAEASSNLSRFDGVRYGRRAEAAADLETMYVESRTGGFGPEVRRRIMLGTHVLSSGYYDAYYLRALKTRRLIKRDYDRVFAAGDGGAGCDCVLMPSSPGPAFRLGEKSADPLSMYLEDIYTVGANLAGLPAITLPAGLVDASDDASDDAPDDASGEPAGGAGRGGIPVGVQLYGPAFEERRLLRAARVLERGLAFADRPPVCATWADDPALAAAAGAP